MRPTDFSYLGSGYKVYKDNFYTRLPARLHLQTFWKDAHWHVVVFGQIGKNTPKTTENTLPKNTERGAIRWYRRDRLLFRKWKDAREFNVCWTIHQAYTGEEVNHRVKTNDGVWRKEPVPIPCAVKEYCTVHGWCRPFQCTSGLLPGSPKKQNKKKMVHDFCPPPFH